MKKLNNVTSIGKYIIYIIYSIFYIMYIAYILFWYKNHPSRGIRLIFFLDQVNFSASGGVGVQLPTVRNCPEFEFFQNSSNTACVSLNTNSGKNFGKIWQHLGELETKETPKRAISWMLHCYKNI